MQESTITVKGQTTLPRDVRSALHLTSGDRVRYVILDGVVRILKARSIKEFKGALKRPKQRADSLEEMEAAIAAGASDAEGNLR
jgi:bifunctional DNA-binding transcriptional regulator/antitoxin component of YhaV-PrlF toxin-antitoxin module